MADDLTMDDAIERLLDGAELGVEAVAEHIIGGAILDAPIREGILRGTGTYRMDRDERSVTATLMFTTPYAAVQHQRLDFNHPLGGKAMYLEDRLLGAIPRATPLIARSAEAALTV